MLTFIPYDLLVLHIIESPGSDSDGTLPGLHVQYLALPCTIDAKYQNHFYSESIDANVRKVL